MLSPKACKLRPTGDSKLCVVSVTVNVDVFRQPVEGVSSGFAFRRALGYCLGTRPVKKTNDSKRDSVGKHIRSTEVKDSCGAALDISCSI